MSIRRTLIVFACLALVGVVLFLYGTDGSAAEIGGDSIAEGGEHHASSPRHVQGKPGAPNSRYQRPGRSSVDDSTVYVEFVDELSGDFLPNARLLRRDVSASCLTVGPETTVVMADRLGRVDFALIREEPSALVAYAPGYLCQELKRDVAASGRVLMRKATSTRVYCVGPRGRPIQGCVVFVSKRWRNRPPISESSTIGQPGVEYPTWSAMSGKDGIAKLDGIPPGMYRMHVFSEKWFSLSPSFHGAYEVMLPKIRVDVTLTPVLGAVFSLPIGVDPKVEMLDYQVKWLSPFSRPAVDVHYFAERWLRNKHPEGVVVLARAALNSTQFRGSVEIQIMLSNGMKCICVSDMLPIDEVSATPLVVKSIAPLRRIRLDVEENRDASLKMGLSSGRMIIPVTSGIVTKVPCGIYGIVAPRRIVAPGSWKWNPKQVTIPRGKGVFPIHVDIGGPARMLRLKSKFTERGCDEPIWTVISHSNGTGVKLTPPALRAGAINLLVPYGKLSISLRALEYGQATHTVAINAKTGPVTEILIKKNGDK